MPAHPKPLERLRATARDSAHKADGRPIPSMAVAVRSGNSRHIPPAPRALGKRGKLEWRKVWTAGFWLKPDQDYHWIEQIARAYDDMETFRARVTEDGLVVTGYAGQVVAHPLIAEIRKCEATIQKCLSVVGFSPTDRARLGLAEAKAQNAVLEMMEKSRRT